MLNNRLYEKCKTLSKYFINTPLVMGLKTEDEIADVLYAVENEHQEKCKISDRKIKFNDEIVSIEDVGIKETIDISVTGDNLFFCNDILTKNSFGLPMTADWMGAIIQNEELFELQKYLLKVIKSRFDDNIHEIYTLGVDRSHMRLLHLDESQQELPVHIKDQLKAQANRDRKKSADELAEGLMTDAGFDFSDPED